MSKVHKSTRIDESLANKVQKMAEVEHRSFTNMLEIILRKYFADSEVQRKETAA